MIQTGIERSVLASYLLIDLTEDDFKDNVRQKLDVESFVLPAHKRIAKKINRAIDKDMPLPLLFQTLQDENKKDNRYDDREELLIIGATLPIGNGCGLNEYISHLKTKKLERKYSLWQTMKN